MVFDLSRVGGTRDFEVVVVAVADALVECAAIGNGGIECTIKAVAYLFGSFGDAAYLVGEEVAIVNGAFGCRNLFESAVGVAIVDRFAAGAYDLCKVFALVVAVGSLFV